MMKRAAIILSLILGHLWPSQAQVSMLVGPDSLSYITSPLDLGDSLSFWLLGEYTEEGSGDPAENNDRVSSWLDQSGNSNHFTQATADLKPTYLTNQINGYPVVYFQYARRLTNISLSPSIYTGCIFMVVYLNQDTTTNRDFIERGNRPRIATNSSEQVFYFSTSGTRTASGYGSINGKWVLIEGWNETSTTMDINIDGSNYVNDGGKTATEYWNTTSSNIEIGDDNSSTFYCAEVIGVCSPSSAQVQAIRNYLNKKYDLY